MERVGAAEQTNSQSEVSLVPTYSAVEDAARALGAVARYAESQIRAGRRNRLSPTALTSIAPRRSSPSGCWTQVAVAGHLDDEQCRQLLAVYGLALWATEKYAVLRR